LAHDGALGATAGTNVKYQVSVGGQSFVIEIDRDWLVWVNGHPLYIDLEQVGGLPVYSLAMGDEGYVVFVEDAQGEYRVEVGGQIYPVEVQSQRPRLTPRRDKCSPDKGECVAVSAPLAGNLVSLPVAASDRVKAGQVVAIVESMKMRMELKTPQAGVVEALYGPAGRSVEKGEELVILASE
jgi:biotin carboxyl carrier protein